MNISTRRFDVITHVVETDTCVYIMSSGLSTWESSRVVTFISLYIYTICSLRPLVGNSLTRWSNLLFELDGARVSSAMLLGPSCHTTGQSPWESRGPRH